MTTRSREGTGALPYTGALGATRYEPVFLNGPDGVARRHDVARGVNAATDPALAQLALDGTLHRVDEGIELAVPYVYHDPALRRFALVVPGSRAHEELALRAQLLIDLARDVSAPIPEYVRAAHAVVGADALRRFLAEEQQPDVSAHDSAAAQARTDELTRREQDLTVREQELTRRADDLVEREHEIARRVDELAERERAIVAREDDLARQAAASETERTVVRAPPPSQSPEAEPLEAEPLESDDDEDEVEPLDDDALVTADPGELAPAPRLALTPSEPVASAARSDASMEVEEISPESDVAEAPTTDVPAAWAARGSDAYAAVVDGEVRLWARGGPDAAARAARGGATVMLQAEPESTLPLALLTVRMPGEAGERDDGRLARAVLDVTRPDDRAVLETLTRDFRVRLEVVSPVGRALGSYPVGAPSEANAQRVLATLLARSSGTEESRRNESERLSREGSRPPALEPFDRLLADDEIDLVTAADTEAAVEAYTPLLEPETFDRVVLSRGVPAARIDSLGRRVILAAMRCGVVPPSRLVALAVRLGIAPDERALAVRALGAYARTCEGGLDSIGRTRRAALAAWSPLLAWAQRAEALVPESVRSTVRGLYDPDDPESTLPPDPRPTPEPHVLAAMTDGELSGWSDHPGVAESVAREMARRDPVRFASPLARALRALPPAACADVAARMAAAGDALGDVWVELLASPRAPAAGAAAAATVVVRLRRGLVPLIQRALSPTETEWKLFGWAAGEFGAAAVKSVGRAEPAEPERLAWLLAHATRAGAGREVERLRDGGSDGRSMAAVVSAASERAEQARSYDLGLRQGELRSDAERAAAGVMAQLSAAPAASSGARAPASERA